MKTKNRVNFSFSILFLCIVCVFPHTGLAAEGDADDKKTSAETKSPLVIGIFPRRNVTTTVKFFTPIAKYLSENLGRKVVIQTARDFQNFWNDVVNQRYDIVHYNQYHYIKSHGMKKYQVIAQNEEYNEKSLVATIMVHKDSGINSLQDLKGKTITFGGSRKAMISYVVPTMMLKRAGLSNKDYTEKFSRNIPNAMLSVYYKQSDAVGIGKIVTKLPSIKNSIDTSQVKILVESSPLSHLPWAVKSDMSDELRDRIQQLLVDLNNSEAGLAVLKSANLTGIHKATDKDYEEHRKILVEVFGNTY